MLSWARGQQNPEFNISIKYVGQVSFYLFNLIPKQQKYFFGLFTIIFQFLYFDLFAVPSFCHRYAVLFRLLISLITQRSSLINNIWKYTYPNSVFLFQTQYMIVLCTYDRIIICHSNYKEVGFSNADCYELFFMLAIFVVFLIQSWELITLMYLVSVNTVLVGRN